MINQHLKKKIINTLGQYEQKIGTMQIEIDVLKDTINQLVIGPMSLYQELKEPIIQLSESLNGGMQPVQIELKVGELSNLIKELHNRESENYKALTILMHQGGDTLKRLLENSQDVKLIDKFQASIEAEHEIRRSLIQYNEVIFQCISSVQKQLEQAQNHANPDSKLVIASEVNESLFQLLNHLSIPEDLDSKKEQIRQSLEANLDANNLCAVLQDLTSLVVESFNVEQNRFKHFLHKITDQLYDFDNYLKGSIDSTKQASSDRNALESGIVDDIKQIKDHIDNASTIEELSSKLSKNFDMIRNRLKDYQTKEQKREQEHESHLKTLQKQLSVAEQTAADAKNLLSLQLYRINHDSLTGLPNRESYDEHISEAFLRWKRSKKKLSLAIADIDFFKKINDNFGHLAGDKVLKKVALIFRSSIRGVDFISRIGGEEFVFIFEQTSSQEAHKVLEKLRSLVAECQFYYRESKVDVTVSFGLTEIQDDDDIESLFVRADKALYKAKHAGRNRVEA